MIVEYDLVILKIKSLHLSTTIPYLVGNSKKIFIYWKYKRYLVQNTYTWYT